MPLAQALHALHVIDDQAPPPHTTEGRVAPEELLIGRDADVEAVGLGPPLSHTEQGLGVSSPMGSAPSQPARHPRPPHSFSHCTETGRGPISIASSSRSHSACVDKLRGSSGGVNNCFWKTNDLLSQSIRKWDWLLQATTRARGKLRWWET